MVEMTRDEAMRLERLAALAELKAHRSTVALAAAQSRCAAIKAAMSEREANRREVIANATDPEAARLAIAFAQMSHQKSKELSADLALAEIERRKALSAAQLDEGRRIALEELRIQAS